MQTIDLSFEGKTYGLELYTSHIGDQTVYTILVDAPELIAQTGRVITYLSDASSAAQAVHYSSEKLPFKGRLKAAIARAIDQKIKEDHER